MKLLPMTKRCWRTLVVLFVLAFLNVVCVRSVYSETVIWSGRFEGDWKTRWDIPDERDFGWENAVIVSDVTFGKVLRVTYPKGSATVSLARKHGVPVGGLQFLKRFETKHDRLTLRYRVRFADNFDWVRGGKLPGLFGGTEISGEHIPDGTDGFSTRYMWRDLGYGEVYAYLPTSTQHGTSLGRGKWRFTKGKWYQLEQEVQLNSPKTANGSIVVRVDGNQVYKASNLKFRTVDSLQIEGLFFSTFFGGGDLTWATPITTHADFAEFDVLH
jgi:hypothetical protein